MAYLGARSFDHGIADLEAEPEHDEDSDHAAATTSRAWAALIAKTTRPHGRLADGATSNKTSPNPASATQTACTNRLERRIGNRAHKADPALGARRFTLAASASAIASR
jgi:hypothetical protein